MIQVTQNAAEFCTLLIDELYGELPARIFTVLLNRGRLSLSQLVQYTSMERRQLRHALAVLLQFNLLFYIVDDFGTAFYEANAEFAYNLIRTGKILEMIESTFGAHAKDVMQSLLLSGQTCIADLLEAYRVKIEKNAPKDNEGDPFDAVSNGVNGDSHGPKKLDAGFKSISQVNSAICRLVEAELVDVVHAKTFQSPTEIMKSVEKEVTDKFFPGGVKGTKGKIEYQNKLAEALQKVRGESKSLKRKLEQSGGTAKRRRLGINGNANGSHADDDEADPALDPKQVIRVNYERCLVDLRNRRLVQFVQEMLGDTSSYVYAVVLGLLTKQLSRCRPNPLIDIPDEDGDITSVTIRTSDILDKLKTSMDLSFGIGKAPKEVISSKAAEKIEEDPPKPKRFIEADVDGDASADESEDDYDSESEPDLDFKPKTNGAKSNPATEQKMDRPTQLRQHLLLLAEHSIGFLRHSGQDEWTVDFESLMRRLREAELDSVIERKSGREGIRLVRILRARGKLDERALVGVALMKKQELQQKMMEMQKDGFVHIQEVPRDNKADVKKSYFLWFCDVDKSLRKLEDNTYQAMVRCIQMLDVMREKDEDVLRLTNRSDVRGQEEDRMSKNYYDRYVTFRDRERKLLGQVMRLDDTVALLRDF
ncbi:hypothetical protein OQA88_12017 [Cercophora sp. LCS_1]